MGEIAEMMLEGVMCHWCGEFIDDGEDCGYPRLCAGCQMNVNEAAQRPRQTRHNKIPCPQCGKRVADIGLAQHVAAKHGQQP